MKITIDRARQSNLVQGIEITLSPTLDAFLKALTALIERELKSADKR